MEGLGLGLGGVGIGSASAPLGWAHKPAGVGFSMKICQGAGLPILRIWDMLWHIIEHSGRILYRTHQNAQKCLSLSRPPSLLLAPGLLPGKPKKVSLNSPHPIQNQGRLGENVPLPTRCRVDTGSRAASSVCCWGLETHTRP